jgi:chromosome segregation ATPase
MERMEDKILQAIEGLKTQITTLSEKVDNQGNQIKENTQILKALEHLAQVNKAEHDKMSLDIAEIRGEIKAMRKDLSNVEIITASNWGDIVRLKSVK